MILERLAVRAFGCFRERVEFGFDERFNIVSGRNEAGKSTLFRALHHALFTPYGSSASEVRDLVPWGTELSPEVVVEFRIGTERYRLYKSFLNQARCTLSEWDGDRFRDLLDGDKADDRVRTYLLGERPGAGAAQSRHRGLGRLLWIPQGETALPEMEGDVKRHIEQSLDAMTLDEGEGKLLAAIAEAYAGIWSKNGKSFVKNSGLPALEGELNQLKARQSELRAALVGAEQAGNKLQGLEAELAQLEEDKSAVSGEIEKLDAEVKRVQQLKIELHAEQASLAEAKSRLERLQRDRDRLRELKGDAKIAAEALEAEIVPQLKQLGKALEDAKADQEAARRDLLEAERSVAEARAAWQRARRLGEALECDAAVRQRMRLIEEVEALNAERDELNERLIQMANPSDADVQRARSLETRLRQIAAKLEAVGIRVSFAAEQDVDGRIRRDGGDAEEFAARAADRIVVNAGRSVEWRIQGVGTFSIESGAEEVAALEKERDRTAHELQELLAPFGAASSDHLATLLQARREVERERAAVESRVRALLSKEGTLDDLKSGVAELERKVAALCRELETEPSKLREVEPPDVDLAEVAFTAAEARLAEQRQALDAAGTRVDKLQSQVSALETDRAVAAQKREHAEQSIGQLMASYGSDDELIRALHEAEDAFERVDARVRSIAAKLPLQEEDPERRLGRRKAELREIEEERHRLSIEIERLKLQLEDVADSGAYESLARIEESLRLKEDEYERQVRRAKAFKLLKALGDARQKQVLDQLTEPVSNRVSRYFEQVTGEVRRIRFDESLRPTAMDVGRVEGVATKALSTGALEQLHVLSRLALGRYLASKNGRMLFVLDDSLVNTDGLRRRRFLDLLLEAADELQIVLLTCHPEWYRGLEGVRKLALESS